MCHLPGTTRKEKDADFLWKPCIDYGTVFAQKEMGDDEAVFSFPRLPSNIDRTN
jgi:hypothetical protein